MGERKDANKPSVQVDGAPDTELAPTRSVLGETTPQPLSGLDTTLINQGNAGSKGQATVGTGSVLGNGRFELGELLGGGAMGVVFRAFDRELSRTVAIKLLRQVNPVPELARVDLLRSEARAIARLSHPNIVHVYDLGIAEGQPFLVMELIDGEPLKTLLDRGPLPLGEALLIADQLLEGLKHAHAAGIVHRDLKPSNVLRMRSGRVAILDFGLAGLDGDEARISGTPLYMAPEQWQGLQQDLRADLWSWGVLLFEMVTGERPFHGRSMSELREDALTGDPFARLTTEVLQKLAPIAHVLARALEKSPERRFQSAGELQTALREATAVAASPAAVPPPEQRQVTLLACTVDVRAPTSDDALQADTIEDVDESGGEWLPHWQAESARLAREHDGLVVSQVGAQLLACFGYPTVSGGAPQLALQAAKAIRQRTAELARTAGVAMTVRAGVATGMAIIEESRDAQGRSVSMIQGGPAQMATRLVGVAEGGEVLLSARTHELVRGWFASEPVSRPGVPQAFRLGAPLDVATRFDISARRGLIPLHGRQPELELQAELWRAASAGTGGALVLIGEAGVGKSRLVHALKQMVGAEGGTVMTAQCWPQRRRTPFHPLVSLLRRSIGLDPTADSEARRQTLAEALSTFSPALRDEVALFARLLSIDGPPLTDSPQKLRARTIEGLSTWLFEMSAIRPLLLVIEDIHWSDPSTLDWLDSIGARLSQHRMLVVLTARPELHAKWTPKADYREHLLGPLPEAAARALAGELAAQLGQAPSSELLDELVQRTGGVPFYLEELLRCVLVADDRARTSARRQIPATLRDTLVATFDRLSPEARMVAQMGAVLERDFRDYMVEDLINEAGVDVDRALRELEEAGVIAINTERRGSRVFFRHALLQEAAYQSLVPAQRRAYHSRAADILLAARSKGADVPLELLASHYDAAGRVAEALDRWEEAGNVAARKWASREAVEHLNRALTLLEQAPAEVARDRRELRLLLALGPPLMSTKGYAAAEVASCYGRAYDLALSTDGSAAELFSPLVGLWQVNMVGGNIAASRALGERLFELSTPAGDPTLILLARRALGTSLFLQGELAAVIEHTRAGIALYDRAVHGTLAFQHGNDPGVAHYMYLAWALCIHGALDEATAVATQARELAEAITHPMSVAFSSAYSAIIENERGDFARASQLAEHSLEVARAHQLELWVAMAELQLGWALAGQGQLAEGIAGMQRGIDGWVRTGARTGTSFFYVVLALMQLRAGEPEAATTSLATAESMVSRNGEHFYEPELRRVAVRVAHQRGEPLAALVPQLRAALAQAEQQRAGTWALRLACDLVELTRGTALAPEAPEVLARAIAAITGGSGTADLIRARALASSALA